MSQAPIRKGHLSYTYKRMFLDGKVSKAYGIKSFFKHYSQLSYTNTYVAWMRDDIEGPVEIMGTFLKMYGGE